MSLPDTTNCPDAYRAYRQWDDEASINIELERLTEAYIGAATSETGKGIIAEMYQDGTFDQEETHNLVVDMMFCSLLAFYGPKGRRVDFRNQVITVADRLAIRIFKTICSEARWEAEKRLRAMQEGSEY